MSENEVIFNVKMKQSYWVVDAVDTVTFKTSSYACTSFDQITHAIPLLEARLTDSRNELIYDIENIVYSQAREEFNHIELVRKITSRI